MTIINISYFRKGWWERHIDSQQGAGSSCTVADKSGDEGWQAFIELWRQKMYNGDWTDNT